MNFDHYLEKREVGTKSISKYIDRKVANWPFMESLVMKYNVIKIQEDNQILGFVVFQVDEKNRAFIMCLDPQKMSNYLRSICDYIFDKVK